MQCVLGLGEANQVLLSYHVLVLAAVSCMALSPVYKMAWMFFYTSQSFYVASINLMNLYTQVFISICNYIEEYNKCAMCVRIRGGEPSFTV